MHPLTKLINDDDFVQESLNPIIQCWAKERSEWLKKECDPSGLNSMLKTSAYAKLCILIDQAFQITPEVCDKCGQEIKP